MPRSQSQSNRSALTAVGLPTPFGLFIAHFSERGLAELHFPRRYAKPPEVEVTTLPTKLREWITLTTQATQAVLAGTAPAALPPLDVSVGTDFQQRVWSALRRIPRGGSRSYAEIAKEIGSPKASRAVGGACGANPIPVLIPCHRVLAAGRDLGGFTAGLDWKLRLLAAEGVETGRKSC